MFGTSHRSIISVAVALAVMLSVTAGPSHADGRWTLSLGGGVADRFTYQTISNRYVHYSEEFGFTGLAVAGAGYRLSDHFTMRADAGYLTYRKSLWGDQSSLTAELPFLATGVRAYATSPTSRLPRLYMEAMPAVWVGQWREHYAPTSAFDFGSPPLFVDDSAFTRVEPGFALGTGLLGPLAGPLKLDVGARYLYSTGPGQHQLGHVSSGDFMGLRQFSLLLGLNWAI